MFIENVINPLAGVFGRLNYDPELERSAISSYYDILFKYDGQTLSKAVQEALSTCKRWPRPVDMIGWCEEFRPRNSISVNENDYPWVVRRKNIKNAVADYLEMYKLNSPLYQQSRSEGWADKLEDVVQEMAEVQAQALFPTPDSAFYYQSSTLACNYFDDPMAPKRKAGRIYAAAKNRGYIKVFLNEVEIKYLRKVEINTSTIQE